MQGTHLQRGGQMGDGSGDDVCVNGWGGVNVPRCVIVTPFGSGSRHGRHQTIASKAQKVAVYSLHGCQYMRQIRVLGCGKHMHQPRIMCGGEACVIALTNPTGTRELSSMYCHATVQYHCEPSQAMLYSPVNGSWPSHLLTICQHAMRQQLQPERRRPRVATTRARSPIL